jgi:hypothetical protein
MENNMESNEHALVENFKLKLPEDGNPTLMPVYI